MPYHRSALKRVKRSEKARRRNSHYKSTLRTAIKRLKARKRKEEAETELKKVVSLLDKLASKGIIHKNRASNQKSKLMRFVNAM